MNKKLTVSMKAWKVYSLVTYWEQVARNEMYQAREEGMLGGLSQSPSVDYCFKMLKEVK
jgi:hypothetical protein